MNRYGPNGEQWIVTAPAYYCGNVGDERWTRATGMAIPCTSRYGTTDCDRWTRMGLTMRAPAR